jgi:HEAT repeat protein
VTDVDAAIAGDLKALNRLARGKHARVAAQLADVGARTKSALVSMKAGALLSRRKTDPGAVAAIAKLLRATPADDSNTQGFEWAAMALASWKQPAALRAAIASYRVMPPGRTRYFLLQTLSNRTQREKPLREHAAFVSLMLDAARDRTDEEERNAAAWALMQLAHPRTASAMIELLADGDDYIEMTAARTLAKIGSAAAQAAVRTFIARCKDAELVTELTKALGPRRRR